MMLEQDIKMYELEITADCNAECPLCARTIANMPLRGNSQISLQQIKEMFPSESTIKGKHFALCGVLGDPIVHPECFEICEWFVENGGDVSISTNGGYNNAEWWTKLAKLKNLHCKFSVDGFENSNHIYRVNVNWKVLVRNMRAFAEAGGEGRWTFIPFGHNEDDYEQARDLAKELGMKFIKRTSGRNALSKKKHKSRKMDTTIKLTDSKKIPHNDLSELKKIYKSNDKKVVDEAVPTISCQFYHNKDHEGATAYIGADSTLWPCCYLYDESKKSYKRVIPSEDKEFNNLQKYSIDEILRTELYTDLKKRWYASHEDHLRRCVKSCGLKGIYKNKRVEDTN